MLASIVYAYINNVSDREDKQPAFAESLNACQVHLTIVLNTRSLDTAFLLQVAHTRPADALAGDKPTLGELKSMVHAVRIFAAERCTNIGRIACDEELLKVPGAPGTNAALYGKEWHGEHVNIVRSDTREITGGV